MAAKTVLCAKLGKELPGIDADSPAGARHLKMITLIAGPDVAKRVRESISAQAMQMWNDFMLMVMNEYRLDPSSDESNKVLAQHLDAFFFGEQQQIPNYVPPDQSQ